MKKAECICYDKQMLESDSEVNTSWRGSKDRWVFFKTVSIVDEECTHTNNLKLHKEGQNVTYRIFQIINIKVLVPVSAQSKA
jgi:hypothetical protein